MDLNHHFVKELGKPKLPALHVGDSVEVHYLIREGDKERVQLFIGRVIATKGRGLAHAIVVRRIVSGEGVERTFPLHSPRVKDVVVTNPNPVKVRRAKLYYMRERSARATRLKEIVAHGSEGGETPAGSDPAPAAPAGARETVTV